MFKSLASEFVYVRTYSRWMNEASRRETWPETVMRYVDFITKHRGDKIPPKVLRKIQEKVLGFEVMPSMRFLWAAGAPAEADNTSIYNCAFGAVDNVDAFAEALYILMCGCGYGFSVEKKYVSQLPSVAATIMPTDQKYIIEDSKKGWADSVKELMYSLYLGNDIEMVYNLIRPAGSRLKTMGGRASGPEPLAQLHSFIREVFYAARGRQLTTLECHDIMNEIAQIVVVGGVRRSSEISLSDLEDTLMREAKIGTFPSRRWMANNSAVYYNKPDVVTFMKEWTALVASERGERGIFNLGTSRATAPKRRRADLIVGTNPCAEIQLRNREFCNLSEVVARPDDDIDTILEKVETATWMGAIQATFTHFPYLSEDWKKNCEEERLLGVSITGQQDAPHLFTEEACRAYKAKAVKVAKKAAEILGIPVPAAVTTVKPSGTVSQLVFSASGLHPRIYKFGIRNYRIASIDPLFKLVRDQGLPVSPENGQRKSDYVKAVRAYDEAIAIGLSEQAAMRAGKSICQFFDNEGWTPSKVNTWVVSFPFKAPEGARTAEDFTAIEQLEYYKKIQKNWCEHNASTTIYVKPSEWLKIGDWVYENWDIVSGISFLPQDDHKYEQAPYIKLTEDEYNSMVANFPKIDYSQLSRYEIEDNTEGAQTVACAGGVCET